MKETDLFPPVKAWLEASGYIVYSEVEGPSGRADVVGVRGPELAVVELKTSLSLDLIEQAQGWTHYAHRVWVGVPKPKRYNNFGRFVLRKFGIGLVEVAFPDDKWAGWVERVTNTQVLPEAQADLMTRPGWNHNLVPGLRKALREEQRSGPPGGNAGGGYVTDYKLMMKRVREYLESRHRFPDADGSPEGWASIRDLLAHVETYYAQPRQSLALALVSFEAAWCESTIINRQRHFRIKEPDAAGPAS